MSKHSFEALRGGLDGLRDQAATYAEQARTSNDGIRASHDNLSDTPGDLEQQAAEHFRSGQAGPELQQIQVAVDSGAVTWAALVRNQGDAATQGVFNANALLIWRECERLVGDYDPDAKA
jgi:hypothetical protein